MLSLPNDCRCSDPTVHPKNWQHPRVSTSKTWYISYRFYDPNYPKPKQVQIMGMNHIDDSEGRTNYTRWMLSNLITGLKNGWNPFLKKAVPNIEPDGIDYIIHPDTPFIKALREALSHLKGTHETKRDARLVINAIEQAAIQLRRNATPLSQVKRRHIRMILDHCRANRKRFTAHTFNFYRANLMMLYKVLIGMEAVEENPVTEIPKEKVIKRMRETMTPEQRTEVDAYLKETDPRFWLYLHIFFHSGSRTKELLRLKGSDIDLDRQRFKCTILKGSVVKEQWRPIKDLALPYWKEALIGCGSDDIVFSWYLKPGKQMIKAIQITRRWREKVKKVLGITADFYSLKHSNLDEVAAALSIGDAAAMAGHTTPVITLNHYAKGEQERQHDRLRKVNNKFAG